MSEPNLDLEQLRARLRELGYLDRGFDRVLFGRPAALVGSRLARLLASLRIALLGALLLAPPLALVATAASPLVRASSRDLWLVAGYLVLALIPALLLLEMLGAGFAVFLTRWRGARAHAPERLAVRIGFIAGSVLFLYLIASWARLGLAGKLAPAPALLIHGTAFLVALAVAAGFGRLVTVAGLLAQERWLPRAPAQARRSAWLVLALGLLAVLFYAAALLWLGPRGAPPPEPAAKGIAIRPVGNRILLVGIDGLERSYLERQLAAGKLPGFGRLVRQGSLAPLELGQADVPSLEWTTIATGRLPRDHNIRTIEVRRLPGVRAPLQAGIGLWGFDKFLGWVAPGVRETLRQPVDSSMLLQPQIWEILGHHGFWVGSVGWWATWPAAPLHGFVVSERAYHTLSERRPNQRDVFPAELFQSLAAEFFDDWRLEMDFRDLLRGAGPYQEALDTPLHMDHYLLRVANQLFERRRPDFEALYLPGLDILRQRLLPAGAEGGLSDLQSRLELAGRYVEMLDGALDSISSHLPAGTILLVVGSPGRARAREDGFLLAVGPNIQSGRRWARFSDLDVTPTILLLMGLPPSARMPGRARAELLEEQARSRFPDPSQPIAGYGPRGQVPAAPPEAGEAMFEALRSLGYVH